MTKISLKTRNNKDSYHIASDGVEHASNKTSYPKGKRLGGGLKDNDIVIMILDLSVGKMSFKVNNLDIVDFGPKIPFGYGIDYRLYVCLYDKPNSVTLIDMEQTSK